jgi:O-Antigen ligase
MNFNNLVGLGWLLVAALPTLWLIKPIMEKLMGRENFNRRMRLWIACTVILFVSPNFWVFLIIYVLLLLLTKKYDPNPVGLFFLLMYVAPARAIELPKIGSIGLLSIDNFMILSMVVLLPALIADKKENKSQKPPIETRIIHSMFWLLFALQALIPLTVDSFTNTLRRTVMLILGTVLIFMACSRLLRSREKMEDALACLLMSLTMMASVAVVETFKQWQLYVSVSSSWSYMAITTFNLRDGALRAVSATETPIVLGQMMVVASAILIFLVESRRSTLVKIQKSKLITFCLLLLTALFFARSRAPWISIFIAVMAYLIMTPYATRRVSTFLTWFLIGSIALLVSPYGSKIIDFLPFIGNLESHNVSYRSNIIPAMWNIMWESPWTGNPLWISELEQFRQGQGIIDPLNVYLSIGMSYGVPAMAALIACIAFAMLRLKANIQQAKQAKDDSTQRLNALILALILSTAVFIYTVSYTSSVSNIIWILIGLAASENLKTAPKAQTNG